MTNESKEELKAELESKFKDVYTTEELREAFEVTGFMAPFVSVVNKENGEEGTMQFTHLPRFYFNFIKAQ